MVMQGLYDIMALGNKSMPESVFPEDGTPPPEQGRQGKKRGPKGNPKGRRQDRLSQKPIIMVRNFSPFC